MYGELRAADLARLLRIDIFNVESAAQFLGIEPEGVIQAARRGRLTHVRYKTLRLFAREDLLDYMRQRGPGRASEIEPGVTHIARHDWPD